MPHNHADGRVKGKVLTLSSNRFLSKLELATVADDDRNLRAVFFVCRDVHDFRDDVFVSTDHPTKHHMFAWCKKKDQSVSPVGRRGPVSGGGSANL